MTRTLKFFGDLQDGLYTKVVPVRPTGFEPASSGFVEPASG